MSNTTNKFSHCDLNLTGNYGIFFLSHFITCPVIAIAGFPSPCWYRGRGKQAMGVMKYTYF